MKKNKMKKFHFRRDCIRRSEQGQGEELVKTKVYLFLFYLTEKMNIVSSELSRDRACSNNASIKRNNAKMYTGMRIDLTRVLFLFKSSQKKSNQY